MKAHNSWFNGKVGKVFRIFVLAMVSIIWSGHTAFSEGLPKESVLPLGLAQEAAFEALKKCEQGNYRVSVAVVDRAGVVKVLLRGDGAGSHTTDSSVRKAYTAASLHEPTQKLAELVAKIPEIEGLRDMNESILILGGGFPIKINDEIVGGIGVGGAPGTKFDEACARAGLRIIRAELYRRGE